MTHDHPPRDSSAWDNPDVCPFCGARLTDGGAGFMDHIAADEACRERFGAWREAVAGDIGGEWGG
jgi:hypothetical protein